MFAVLKAILSLQQRDKKSKHLEQEPAETSQKEPVSIERALIFLSTLTTEADSQGLVWEVAVLRSNPGM
jgi:hypothetical protein